MKDFLIPVFTFLAGLLGGLWPHVQKPLTDYRKALSDISAIIIANARLMWGRSWDRYASINKTEEANENLMKFSTKLRELQARLLSSSSTIPRFARGTLRTVGLLRSPKQIEEGAKMLVGISNQLISPDKDPQHLDELVKRLGIALDINVGDS